MTKIEGLKRSQLLVAGWLVFLAMAALGVSKVLADAVIAQNYQSDTALTVGSIVSLDKSTPGKVKPANISNVDNLFGVVVGKNDALLSVTGGQKNQVEVTTGGVVDVIVSDVNGDIVTGDKITASQLDGVGMKATSNVTVIGVAQADLATSPETHSQTYKDATGKQQQAKLGSIPVLVNVAYYFKQPDKTIIPSVIQNVADTIASKTVSPLPVIISLVIFLVAAISIISLVYGAIRSSIISIGRNPLSQAAVYRSLLQVSALVLAILGVAIAAIYLILTKL